jgi:hypothetical protein
MIWQRWFHERHQFRLALCGHKAVEAGTVCVLLMVHGQLAMVTLAHVGIASKTGLMAVFPALGITFTRYARHFARHFANRWTSSAPGEYTKAALSVGNRSLSVAAQ